VSQEQFIVVDFIVRRVGGPLQVNGKLVRMSSKGVAERAAKRIESLLTKNLKNKRERIVSEIGETGDADNRTRQGHPHLISLVLTKATLEDVMKMEDVLRAASRESAEANGQKVTDAEEVVIPLKMRDDASKKYFTMEATEFRLSGPKSGGWRPFTEWYKGAKSIGLPHR
jgi:hypothetical protein